MRAAKVKIKKFRKVTRFPHHRSEGVTWRKNSGSHLQGPPRNRKQ
jgi:hypothetical protein